ncbi:MULTISPECIES: M3 family oligoendopeptidase [unclassified Acidocella]|uniref:M3 family oligoendopeptidase n=1 Tax=unclassified Acidocella TaxID=2648610 RepID=UPI00028DA361|nr:MULTISPECIES: M3 family oligoendopeptidase [unclassified Acidocella]EKM99294.1 oligoendopeptidase F [Acidocella sp. MX-AZ02]WBO57953.1 M3 family oligoendopeptidase [Acidocella sp. MX-AZ03]
MKQARINWQPEGLSAGNAASLPSWDLNDLYTSTADPRLAADLQDVQQRAEAFTAYQGKLEALSGAELAEAIRTYEALQEIPGRIMSYAGLLFAADSSIAAHGQFYQTMSEKLTALGTKTLFFTLELNRLSDEALAEKLRAPELQRYESWLRDLRVFLPHQREDVIEQLFMEKEVTGHSAWTRLFDETIAALRLEVRGEELTLSAALNKLSDTDRAVREDAFKAVAKTMAQNEKLFALVLNTIAKDKAIDDDWHAYPHPWSFRNRANMVEDEVVEALVGAVKSSYGRLSHRYYALKAKWLGLEKLEQWDRNAPLPADLDKHISWQQARDIVLNAYGGFSPELAETIKPFFEKNWIDADLRPGKAGGAFSHSTVPSVHPYVLMNFHGKARDVMTLAHELGHGAHQSLAAKQGYLLAGTPLTLAETASVFGEMLTFRSLLDAETDPARRRIMLAQKVEDMLNTVVRQIAFHEFEVAFHTERAQGEILPERIAEIWLDVQTRSLGLAFNFTEDYKVFWAYISHFFHSPFYVYAYAFGDCLVNALYAVYQESPDKAGFAAKYRDMLAAGGTKRHKALLAPFGLDASDPAFWNKGLDVISGFIDELENA